MLCSLWPQDAQLKLALVQSITEVSRAIQAVGNCSGFELSLKSQAMQTLLVSARSRGGGTGEFWAAPSDCFPKGMGRSLGFVRAPGAVCGAGGALECWCRVAVAGEQGPSCGAFGDPWG